jgi:NAD(P)H-hydrate epimerase
MELLTPDQMSRADQLTIAAGTDSYALMCNAGEAVYQQASSFWPDALRIAVLCGHGNNGGDGYVVARHYRQGGKHVYCFSDLPPYDITQRVVKYYLCRHSIQSSLIW